MATKTFNEWDTIPKRIDGKRPARKRKRRPADFDFWEDTRIGEALTIAIMTVGIFVWIFFFQIVSFFLEA